MYFLFLSQLQQRHFGRYKQVVGSCHVFGPKQTKVQGDIHKNVFKKLFFYYIPFIFDHLCVLKYLPLRKSLNQELIDQQRSIRHPHERSSLNCILEEDDKEKHVHCDPIEKTNL